MKRFLSLIFGLMVFCTASATTINLNWQVDGNNYAQTTCESGGDLNIPSTPPTKYGYTFGGWVDGDYIKLDYIESTGTQYIDTGYRPNDTTVLNIVAYYTGVVPNKSSLGAVANVRWTDSPDWSTFGFSTSSAQQIVAYFGSYQEEKYLQIQHISLNTLYDLELGLISTSVNGRNVMYAIRDTFQSTETLYVFATNFLGVAQSFSMLRLYSMTIKENNTLIRDFIPVKRISDGVVGLYDTVSGTFFTNSGTGGFIAGPMSANQSF